MHGMIEPDLGCVVQAGCVSESHTYRLCQLRPLRQLGFLDGDGELWMAVRKTLNGCRILGWNLGVVFQISVTLRTGAFFHRTQNCCRSTMLPVAGCTARGESLIVVMAWTSVTGLTGRVRNIMPGLFMTLQAVILKQTVCGCQLAGRENSGVIAAVQTPSPSQHNKDSGYRQTSFTQEPV